MLRVVLVVLVGAAFLLLSVANWSLVPFLLPDGRSVQVPLPMIIAGAFLAGWLPTWLSGLASRAMMKRKLERAERLLIESQARAAAAVELSAPTPAAPEPTPAEA
jgi:uncharacterized integral membrane protein